MYLPEGFRQSFARTIHRLSTHQMPRMLRSPLLNVH